MSTSVSFSVLGIPAPQGSKRLILTGDRPRMIEASAKSRPWRDSVAHAAAEAMTGAPYDGPVTVTIAFTLTKPKSVRRHYPTVAPDIDKLARTCLDGIQLGGIITDDARVIDLHTSKRYGERPGALITVTEVAA